MDTQILLAHGAALLGILAAGVVYGTDVFGALVLRPALARVDDATLTAVMGNVHRYGDRRMPLPGVVSIVAAAAATLLAVFDGAPVAAIASGVALALLIAWTVLYARISAPINRRMTAAADAHETPADIRDLQTRWDSIIVLRATLQGLAVLALALCLVLR